MNDEAFIEFAGALAKRITKEGGSTDEARLNYAYELVLGRKPIPKESARLLKFVADQRQTYSEDTKSVENLLLRPAMKSEPGASASEMAELAAWTSVGRVMLNLDEFMTRD